MLEAAVAAGHPGAHVVLARWLQHEAVRDYARALLLARRATELGDERGKLVEARLLLHGRGLPKDTNAAQAAIDGLCAAGLAEACDELGQILFFGDEVASDQTRAVAAWMRADQLGGTRNLYMLAYALRHGKGVKADPARAIALWERADALGDKGAALMLGRSYQDGEIVPKSEAKAFEYLRRAAVRGDQGAQLEIAKLYLRGEGVAADPVLAYAWANLSATNPALANTRITVNGLGVDAYEHARSEAEPVMEDAEARMTSAMRAEAQRISVAWAEGRDLTRESDSANASGTSRGSAFFVSRQGHAITNAHVVSECASLVLVGSTEAKLAIVTQDQANDLALLKIDGGTTAFAVLRSNPNEVKQGDSIFVFGYPLLPVLAVGGNVTPGLVTALSGISNSSSQIQISAPIQPGSSGSPVIDREGTVIGVVAGKISDTAMARATGQVGQVLNFAISGQTLTQFLRSANVPFETGPSWFSRSKDASEIADLARTWTVAIECRR